MAKIKRFALLFLTLTVLCVLVPLQGVRADTPVLEPAYALSVDVEAGSSLDVAFTPDHSGTYRLVFSSSKLKAAVYLDGTKLTAASGHYTLSAGSTYVLRLTTSAASGTTSGTVKACPVIELEEMVSVDVPAPDGTVDVRFTPEYTDIYQFVLSGSSDLRLAVYQGNTLLTPNISAYSLTAGKVYTLRLTTAAKSGTTSGAVKPYQAMALDQEAFVEVPEPNGFVEVLFTPAETGYYHFSKSGGSDLKYNLYTLTNSYVSPSSSSQYYYWLTGGKTYKMHVYTNVETGNTFGWYTPKLIPQATSVSVTGGWNLTGETLNLYIDKTSGSRTQVWVSPKLTPDTCYGKVISATIGDTSIARITNQYYSYSEDEISRITSIGLTPMNPGTTTLTVKTESGLVAKYKVWVRNAPAFHDEKTVMTQVGRNSYGLTWNVVGTELTYELQTRATSQDAWKTVPASEYTVRSSSVGTGCSKVSIEHKNAVSAHQYRLIITDKLGQTATSKAVTLYILEVTSQPQDAYKKVGGTATFTVKATGLKKTYQWQYSDGSAWKNATAEGNKTATLKVPVTVVRNGYSYRCKITDSKGNVTYSEPAVLYVLAVKEQPESICSPSGRGIRFHVSTLNSHLLEDYGYYWDTFQWQYKATEDGTWKNTSGNSVEESTMRGYLDLYVSAEYNGYYYRCKITDKGGNVIYSNTVRLWVLNVTQQPQDAYEKVGDTASFTVKATGLNKTYQWQYSKDSATWTNTTLDSAKTATLKVPVTEGRNGYYYRCKITDKAGNVVYTNPAVLWVTAITKQPKTVCSSVDQYAAFEIKTLTEFVSFQWQYKATEYGSWKNISSEHDDGTYGSVNKLFLLASAKRNGWYFRCKITDFGGNVIYSNTVRLWVLNVTTQPQDAYKKVGDTASFTVKATGSGKTYQWQYSKDYNGEDVDSATWTNTTLDSAKTATLKVPATAGRNGYYYRCKITDKGSNVVYSDPARLYVLSIVQQPKDVYAVVGGDTINLELFTLCSRQVMFGIMGTCTETFQWQYKATEGGTWKNVEPDYEYEYGYFQLDSTPERNGFYRCKITDFGGNVIYSDTVRVSVLSIKTQPKDRSGAVGESVTFSVTATGHNLKYQWKYYDPHTGTTANTTLTGAKTAKLTVPVTKARNGMYYFCVITDSAGNTVTTNQAILTVK